MYPPGRGLCPLPPENTRKVWKRLVILGVGFVLLAQTYAGPIAALAATIQTDLFVYQNGDTVTVTGDGFGAAEDVDLPVHLDDDGARSLRRQGHRADLGPDRVHPIRSAPHAPHEPALSG